MKTRQTAAAQQAPRHLPYCGDGVSAVSGEHSAGVAVAAGVVAAVAVAAVAEAAVAAAAGAAGAARAVGGAAAVAPAAAASPFAGQQTLQDPHHRPRFQDQSL